MMKSKDLMIGDWVYVPHDGCASHNGKVKALYESETVSTELEGAGCLCRAESLQPIPLTAKILEKNGFTICDKDDDGAVQYEFGGKDLGIDLWLKTEPPLLGAWRRWDDCDEPYPMIEELPIHFVHQLQHAIRLCGIEKEITL